MQNCLHNPEVYDFRQHDQVWQRVGPQMVPYPDMHMQNETTMTATNAANHGGLVAAQEATLPGAVENPCCMGSAAEALLEVIAGYIEEELEDQRTYRALARVAPAWARQQLRQIADEEGEHARRLMAVYYLITGTCYCPAVTSGSIHIDSWCAALRNRYHEEACGGLNYQRTADDTSDICLSRLLTELSADEFHHAEQMMKLLERSLRCTN